MFIDGRSIDVKLTMPCGRRLCHQLSDICCSRFTFSWSDIFKRNEYRETKLFKAVTNDHFNCVKRLIDEGADVNIVNKYGFTPVMFAAERGYVCCLNILIAAGADIDKVERNFPFVGKPALIRAAKTGNWECVSTLINAGADVNITLENRFTPLMHATYMGHVKCVELLIAAGADVNMTNTYGNTSISQIPRYTYKAEIVEMLIKAGADVNAPDLYGQPQILSAVRKGTWSHLKFVIESGADVNAVDLHNNTALMCAADKYNTAESDSCLRVLLQSGARINIVNKDHHNALSQHWERRRPDGNICLLLFAAGETVKKEMIEEIENSGPEFAISKCFPGKTNLDLKHLCRDAIRNHLLHLDPHNHLFWRVPQLGLPKIITDDLVYDVSLETK